VRRAELKAEVVPHGAHLYTPHSAPHTPHF
jgi:hypothetical protein